MLTTDSTSPTTPPTPPTDKGTRGLFNATQLQSLTKSEKVAEAAQVADYAALLVAEQISAARVQALAQKAAQARSKISLALSESDLGHGATRTEKTARSTLAIEWQDAQSRALQKFGTASGAVPSAYGIGINISKDAALELIQLGDALKARLASDALPGHTPAKIQAFGDAFDAWKAASNTQEQHQRNATTARLEAAALIEAAQTERYVIQFAADRLFPYRVATNKKIRQQFQIPLGQPFRVPKAKS